MYVSVGLMLSIFLQKPLSSEDGGKTSVLYKEASLCLSISFTPCYIISIPGSKITMLLGKISLYLPGSSVYQLLKLC